MRRIRYTRRAAAALLRHRNRAPQLMAKIEAYAADPAAFANNVKALQGMLGLRLRVGEFRVIIDASDEEIVVLDIGPRGSVHD